MILSRQQLQIIKQIMDKINTTRHITLEISLYYIKDNIKINIYKMYKLKTIITHSHITGQ